MDKEKTAAAEKDAAQKAAAASAHEAAKVSAVAHQASQQMHADRQALAGERAGLVAFREKLAKRRAELDAKANGPRAGRGLFF